MNKVIVGVIISVLVITGGILYLQRGQISSYLIKREYQQMYACVDDTDCVLVQQSGWCREVSAVNKNFEDEWYRQDEKTVELAEQGRWTCEPSLAEHHNMNNFKALCEGYKCTARFSSPEKIVE